MDNITEKMKLHQQWLHSKGFDGHKIELDKQKLYEIEVTHKAIDDKLI